MHKYSFVTSFGPGGWEQYARRMVESWVQHGKAPLTVYYHDQKLPKDAPRSSKIKYVDLNKVDKEFVEWRQRAQNAKGMMPNGQYNFRLDAFKFAPKVFALTHLASTKKHDRLVWLDGDTFLTGKVDAQWLDKFCKGEVVHLGRQSFPYSETSFIVFDTKARAPRELLADLRDVYVDGEIFFWQEWHDGFIFERLLYLHKLHGLKAKSLTPPAYKGIDAFENSVLNERIKHLKGARKVQQKALPQGMVPLRVNPVDCMPKPHIQKNVVTNMKLLKRWISKKAQLHDGKAIVVSAGLSLPKYLKEIKEKQRQGAKIFAVKHALPTLLKAGIVPWALVVLDPRNVKGESTHGIVRTSLLDSIPKETKCFIASMSDPSVTRHIMKRNKNCYGWHAYTNSLAQFKKIPPNALMVTGGTCAAWRCIGLGNTLGFTEFDLYGFDFYVDPKSVDLKAKDEKGRPKYLKIAVGPKRKKFYSTGELVAAAQDAQEIFKRVPDMGLVVRCHGDGLGPMTWKHILGKIDQRKPSLEELLK